MIEISDRKKIIIKKIVSLLEKKNFIFLKKHMNHSVTLFSNTKSGDYLFINEKEYE